MDANQLVSECPAGNYESQGMVHWSLLNAQEQAAIRAYIGKRAQEDYSALRAKSHTAPSRTENLS